MDTTRSAADSPRAAPAPRADQKTGEEQPDRARQRPLIALDVDLAPSKCEIVLCHGAEYRLENRFESFALGA